MPLCTCDVSRQSIVYHWSVAVKTYEYLYRYSLQLETLHLEFRTWQLQNIFSM